VQELRKPVQESGKPDSHPSKKMPEKSHAAKRVSVPSSVITGCKTIPSEF
jgi:hypothetical protein